MRVSRNARQRAHVSGRASRVALARKNIPNVHIATGFHDLMTTRDFWSDMARLGAAANTLVFFFLLFTQKI